MSIDTFDSKENVKLIGIAALLLMKLSPKETIKKSSVVFLASAIDVSVNGANGDFDKWLRLWEAR